MKSEVRNQKAAEHLGADSQPWETSNGILAFCLYLSGVQFLTTRNLYTADTLRALGFTGETDMLEAAKQCVASNKKGDLKYLFQRPRALKRLLEIFSDQERILQDEVGDAMDVVHDLMGAYAANRIDLHEAVMRIACLILKLRGGFLTGWREQSPLVQIDNPGKSRHFATTAVVQMPGGGTKVVPAKGVESPGFKIVSANASDATKKRMGLLS
jgi:hypothetical protein